MKQLIQFDNSKILAEERYLAKRCRKLQKILSAEGEVRCRVAILKKGFCVKISLLTSGRQFSVEAAGLQLSVCTTKALNRLKRQLEDYCDTLKGHDRLTSRGAFPKSRLWVPA